MFGRVRLDYLDRKLLLEGSPRRVRVVEGSRLDARGAVERALGEAGRGFMGLRRRRLRPLGVKLYYYPYWIYVVEFSIRALPLWRLSRHETTLSLDGVNGHTTFADRPPSWSWVEASGDELVRLFVDSKRADKIMENELPKLAAMTLGGHIISARRKTKFLVYKPIWVVVAEAEGGGRRAAAIIDAITGGVGVVWYPRGRSMPPVFEGALRAGLHGL